MNVPRDLTLLLLYAVSSFTPISVFAQFTPMVRGMMGRPNRAGWFQGKRWGMIRQDGTIVIPFVHHTLEGHGDLLISQQGNLQYLIRANGERITPGYSSIFPISGGYLTGKELNPGVSHGFLDEKGKVLALTRYEEVAPPAFGIITAKSGGAWGWINQSHQMFFAPEIELDSIQVLKADMIIGVQTQQKRIIGFRPNGHIQFDLPATDWPEVVGKALKFPGKKGNIQWVNFEGEKVGPVSTPPPSKKSSIQTYESFFEDGKWGFKDGDGNIIIKPILDRPGAFSNNLASPVFNGKQGVMDTKGQWIIQPTFDSLSEPGFNGRRVGTKDRTTGVWVSVSTMGEEVIIPGRWSMIEPFDSQGRAIAVEF